MYTRLDRILENATLTRRYWRPGSLILLLLLLYGPAVTLLASMWVSHDQLHGFLVPFISLWLVWTRRESLRRLRVNPSIPLGLPLVLIAGMLLVVGEVGGVAVLGQMSLLVMIAGLVLLLLGTAYFTVLAFPIAYLFFMLTILEDVVAPLHWPFQLMTAKQGVGLLRALGMPALVEAQYIVLPHIVLEVANVCSGVNYLISITAIAAPLAYLTLKGWWCRGALVLFGLAIGVIANWVRIVLIALWSYWGGAILHGPFHIFQGMFVAWVAYLFLFMGAWGLSRGEKYLGKPVISSGARSPVAIGEVRRASEPRSPRGAWHRAWRIAVMTLASFAAFLFTYDPAPAGLKSAFADFPDVIEAWVGDKAGPEQAPFRVRGADQEFFRTYRNDRGRRIHLYVAYWATQHQGKEAVSYETAELHQEAKEVKVRVGPEKFITVNQGLRRNRDTKERILFWYDTGGRVIASRFQTKMAIIMNGLFHGRTNGALVLLVADPAERGFFENEAAEETFIRDLLPVLRGYLP